MLNIIKAGTYKVEIEFTLEEDTSETELDNIFEDAMYNNFNDISSSDFGEYIPVKKEERKTIMTTRAQIQQEYGIVDTMPSYIADRELSPKEEENYRKIMDARKDGELVVDGFDLDR